MVEKMRNIPVDEYTTPSPVFVGPKTPLNEVVKLMRVHEIRHIPVVENGQPVGIISDRDLKLVTGMGLDGSLKAEQIMTPDPYTVSPETSLDEVVFTMSQNKYGSAIVQNEEGEVTGIFTSTDALNALIEIVRGQVE